jgi:hypothetical protein
MSVKITITITKAVLLRDVCTFSTMDPYFVASYGNNSFKSKVLNNAGKYPVWNETFVFDYGNLDVVSIDVFHEKEVIGNCLVPLKEITSKGGYNEGDYDLVFKGKNCGRIYLKIKIEGYKTSTDIVKTEGNTTYTVQFNKVGEGNSNFGNNVGVENFCKNNNFDCYNIGLNNNIGFNNNQGINSNITSNSIGFNSNTFNNGYNNAGFNSNFGLGTNFESTGINNKVGNSNMNFNIPQPDNFTQFNTSFQSGDSNNFDLSNNFNLSNNINLYQGLNNQVNIIQGGNNLITNETIWHQTLTYPKNCLFFRNNTGNLFYFNFQNQSWVQINLDGNVFFPKFMRATELPDDTFFLTGGEYNKQSVFNTFHFINGHFKDKSKMSVARKAHSAIYLKGFVYIFGGFADNGIIADCEKFDMNKNIWINIAKIGYAKAYATPLTYGSNYIFLIGGFSSTKFEEVIAYLFSIMS